MIRDIDINEISDGKKYKSNDLVKIGCNECEGCSECCKNMAGLITLDPYDVYRIIEGLNHSDNCVKNDKAGKENGDSNDISCSGKMTFESLLNESVELIVDETILLPALKMNESGSCTFLNTNGRCSIHKSRPGICRLFPLGRLYEEGSFFYFLQKDECSYKNKTKVKIKNWLETDELSKYEKFVCDWHYFINDIKEYLKTADEAEIRQINTALLQMFYIRPYISFYDEFYARLEAVKKLL